VGFALAVGDREEIEFPAIAHVKRQALAAVRCDEGVDAQVRVL